MELLLEKALSGMEVELESRVLFWTGWFLMPSSGSLALAVTYVYCKSALPAGDKCLAVFSL